jgi:methylenetetrahydrofolate reductase (NADPH)
MKLNEIYAKKNIVSFEVFPQDGLYDELIKLKAFEPAFISLTQTGGGKCSVDILDHIKNTLNMDVMAHLICSSADSITEIEALGIENILALRGDNVDENSPLKYASELVEFIHSKTDLCIGVAGYPEGHIECPDLFTDIENLKRKVDAGASAIFTQLFFNNDLFFSYVQLVRDAGIDVPIIPGIMPIISKNQIERMTSLARITVPKPLMERIEKFQPDDIIKMGIEFASIQCQQLIDAGVAGLHFYTLNRSYSTAQILENLLC